MKATECSREHGTGKIRPGVHRNVIEISGGDGGCILLPRDDRHHM